MRTFLSFCLVLSCVAVQAQAAQITGEYIEARSCDVYTGPCFANGEIGLAGQEALMAWKVDKGEWNGVKLDGLGAVLVVKASDTLGFNTSFAVNPFPAKSVILVDEKASEAQKDALVKFVKDSAGKLAEHVMKVESVAFSLTNDHLSGKGQLRAGKLAKVETRAVAEGDCICTNEEVFYPPLTKVQNSQPCVALTSSFEGKGLDTTWTIFNKRSAFVATFRK